MSSVTIRKVDDKKSLEAFIQFHYDLYRDNPYDAPNLHNDEMHTLRKDKNAAFEFCEADYFLAYRDGKVVGRIAKELSITVPMTVGTRRVCDSGGSTSSTTWKCHVPCLTLLPHGVRRRG